MPKRTDLKRVLVIGSGPIVIGQACEFDYSGSQACKALRAEGLEVILVNSNPATIMTDPELADRTYVEPLTPDILGRIIERERPDALLPTVGGQTALNLAVDLANEGILDKFGVRRGRSASTCREAAWREAWPRRPNWRRRSVFRWSSGHPSRLAASAAASPTTWRNSATRPNGASS
jgi:hypothetical protein